MTKECEERKYNGWSNYETWVVRLWLDNEEPSYRYWTGQARVWHGRERAAYRLAEQLREELTEASPVNEPTVYGDLMNAALEEVNWLEIAESYLDEIGDEAAEEGENRAAADGDSDAESLFGPVIFAYTREQAVADGELVDVTETANEAGFKVPVALTRAVWSEYVAVPEGVEGQDEVGRLWDILSMCRWGVERWNRVGSMFLFHLQVRNDNREGEVPVVQLKAVCGPDDDAKPCVTVMLPDED